MRVPQTEITIRGEDGAVLLRVTDLHPLLSFSDLESLSIEELGGVLIRHGGKHDWYQNPATRNLTACPIESLALGWQ